MTTPFRTGSERWRSLGAAVSDLVETDRQIRRLEARRMGQLVRVRRLAQEDADATAAEMAAEGRRLGTRHAELTHRAAEVEVACALGLSDRVVAKQIDHADRVVREYPGAHASLAAGSITTAHTVGIVEAGLVVDGTRMRRAYEAEILRYAESEPPNRTRRMAKVLAEKHACRTFEERHASARDRRTVCVIGLDDGMAELRAIMDATSTHAIYGRLCQQARIVQGAERATAAEAKARAAAGRPEEAPGVRSLDQIRAELAADTLLNGTPSNDLGEVDLSGIRARVQVTVPVLSLLQGAVETDRLVGAGGSSGVDSSSGEDAATAVNAATDAESTFDETGSLSDGARRYLRIAGLQGAATLAGHGPIDSATARLLAGLQAGWDRICCDPLTGDVLSVDRYRPSAEIARFIVARDVQCRFMDCNVVAHRADQDHTLDAALGGETSVSNLAVLCRRHHVMKHHTAVTVAQGGGGVLEWVSTLGRRLRDTPVSRVMFRPIVEPAESDRCEEQGPDPPY